MSLNQAGQTLSSKECISGEEAWDKMCLGRAGCIAYCPVQAGRQAMVKMMQKPTFSNRTENWSHPRDALEYRQSQFL